MENREDKFIVPKAIVMAGVLIAASIIYQGWRGDEIKAQTSKNSADKAMEIIMPKEGVGLPIVWGDLGVKLVEAGVIDEVRFRELYKARGGLSPEEEQLLSSKDNGLMKITRENAGYLLNLLWALGLGNKNEILEKGEMSDPKYGGAGNFASTGGWSLSVGNAMNHYSRHNFIELTPEQQEKVARVAKGIYRPCCGNSTHFPDCNHGMAMLGLLELMTAQGVGEEEMYRIALIVNSYWFPDTYANIMKYFEDQGIKWSKVDPKIALGAEYSSLSGYRKVLSELQGKGIQSGGGGCSV